jgi:hypothetical protein
MSQLFMVPAALRIWFIRKSLKTGNSETMLRLITTVDPGGETPDWKGEMGFVPTIVEKAAPSSKDTIAIVCGPPVMIKYTFPVLAKLGFTDENIYTTLENRMKCGFGKCGRCNVGKVYVCKDGPVFTACTAEGITGRVLVILFLSLWLSVLLCAKFVTSLFKVLFLLHREPQRTTEVHRGNPFIHIFPQDIQYPPETNPSQAQIIRLCTGLLQG